MCAFELVKFLAGRVTLAPSCIEMNLFTYKALLRPYPCFFLLFLFVKKLYREERSVKVRWQIPDNLPRFHRYSIRIQREINGFAKLR